MNRLLSYLLSLLSPVLDLYTQSFTICLIWLTAEDLCTFLKCYPVFGTFDLIESIFPHLQKWSYHFACFGTKVFPTMVEAHVQCGILHRDIFCQRQGCISFFVAVQAFSAVPVSFKAEFNLFSVHSETEPKAPAARLQRCENETKQPKRLGLV